MNLIEGDFSQLKQIICLYKPKSVFLVTGKGSYSFSGAKDIVDSLNKETSFVQFNDFRENPLLSDAQRGIELYNKSGCDFIVAVGGGSVIDMAKIISCMTANNDIESIVKGVGKVSCRGPKLVVAPTTSGTGSEATHFAVLYIGKSKYSLASEYLLPDYVILDPQLTFSTPKYITATTGLDAFSQALESYWSINSNEESLNYASEAMALAVENLPNAVNINAEDARRAMMKASFLAGKAINITKTTAPHAMSYTFTSYHDLPHGHAVALTLPFFLKYNYSLTSEECNDSRGVAFVKGQIDKLITLLGAKDIDDAVAKLKLFIESLGVEIDYKKLGLTDSDLQRAVNNVNLQRLKNNPRRLNEGFVLEL